MLPVPSSLDLALAETGVERLNGIEECQCHIHIAYPVLLKLYHARNSAENDVLLPAIGNHSDIETAAQDFHHARLARL